jgi:hypothetical protein
LTDAFTLPPEAEELERGWFGVGPTSLQIEFKGVRTRTSPSTFQLAIIRAKLVRSISRGESGTVGRSIERAHPSSH